MADKRKRKQRPKVSAERLAHLIALRLLQQIVELGKRATVRPWAHFHGKLRPQFDTWINEIQSPSGAVVLWPGFDCSNLPPAQRKRDAAYIAAAANSADILAQQHIELLKLCEKHQAEGALMMSVASVRAILEGK